MDFVWWVCFLCVFGVLFVFLLLLDLMVEGVLGQCRFVRDSWAVSLSVLFLMGSFD